MRALHVLGIAENGAHLVCVGEERADGEPETFTLPLDDRLRAAVRGDLSRFGQLEIEMEPQLRPREIQARIRAGASVEQVAAAAGCTPERIERYAYPVLLERVTIADRAQKVRPLQGAALGSVGAANSTRTLREVVAATLADRGQHDEPSWDAFRDERGWTVTVTWRTGRSENHAEWAYRPGPDGGSVTPRNQVAADLLDPAPRPLRTVAAPAGTVTRTQQAPIQQVRTQQAHTQQAPTELARSEQVRAQRTRAESLVVDTVVDQRSGALPAVPVSPAQPSTVERAERTGTDGGPAPSSPPSGPSREADSHSGHAGSARTKQRGHRAPMPSWEDVLLGTRTSER